MEKQSAKDALSRKKSTTFQDILDQEKLTQELTKKNYAKWFKVFEQSIDMLLRIPHELEYQGEQLPDKFNLRVTDRYLQMPFSLRSCSLLMERGLYHDSIGLLRPMIENLVKLRFLANNKDKIEKKEAEPGKKIKKPTIKDMFTFVAGEDSYERVYTFLCQYTHKDPGTNTPTLTALLSGSRLIYLIPRFSKVQAELIIPNLLSLLFGYINAAPFLFEGTWKVNPEYEEIKNQLVILLKGQEKIFPTEQEYWKAMKKICDY